MKRNNTKPNNQRTPRPWPTLDSCGARMNTARRPMIVHYLQLSIKQISNHGWSGKAKHTQPQNHLLWPTGWTKKS